MGWHEGGKAGFKKFRISSKSGATFLKGSHRIVGAGESVGEDLLHGDVDLFAIGKFEGYGEMGQHGTSEWCFFWVIFIGDNRESEGTE